MALAAASMTAVTAAAAPRLSAKGANRVASTLAQRTAARKAAATMASRHVHAIIAEETEATAGANSELYDQFAKLLVDYEFAYKVGDKISGKCFHCDSKGAWVDIGAKAAALCPASEASLATVKNVSFSTAFLLLFLSPGSG